MDINTLFFCYQPQLHKWPCHFDDDIQMIVCLISTVLFFLFLFLYLVSYLITFPQSVKSNPIRISSRSWNFIFILQESRNKYLTLRKTGNFGYFFMKNVFMPRGKQVTKTDQICWYVKIFFYFKMITEGYLSLAGSRSMILSLQKFFCYYLLSFANIKLVKVG